MRTAPVTRRFAGLLTLAACLGLTACSQDMADLEQYVNEVKQRPGGRIEPLPQVKPYKSFAYGAGSLRSPFVPESRIVAAQRSVSGVRPDATRNREYLEGFSLDVLRMVGSLTIEGTSYALVQEQGGLIHRVRPGNYIGQNDGRITAVSDSEIELIEIVPDGLGGYIERPAAIALSE